MPAIEKVAPTNLIAVAGRRGRRLHEAKLLPLHVEKLAKQVGRRFGR